MTAGDWHDDRRSKSELLQRLILCFVADGLPKVCIIDVCKQLGSTRLKYANDRQCFVREILGPYLDLLCEVFLFGIDMGNQTGSDLVAVESQVHKAPVCESRNG